MTGQIAAHHHLYFIGFTTVADGDHGIDGRYLPVGEDILRKVQELGGKLVKDLSLVGNALRKDNVEGRYTVCRHHHQVAVVEGVHIADFSRVF